ncbi:hypothetical protein DK762_05785 [Salmonella enterica subsp. houtenae]|nr:hypothetical protein [Salmonella enterica subsp. houtenae]ECI3706345.1 hypothetical protein [Salmonella enterica subsp. houtenae]MLR84602.1 hypothetical protein [Salmonella enterica subsp. houtenae]
MVGAQKGAFRSAVFIFLLFFIVLHDDLSPAFAPRIKKQAENLKQSIRYSLRPEINGNHKRPCFWIFCL